MRKVIVLAAGVACFGIASSARAQQADSRQNRATCVEGLHADLGSGPNREPVAPDQNIASLARYFSEIVSLREADSRSPFERQALERWLTGRPAGVESAGMSAMGFRSRTLPVDASDSSQMFSEHPLELGFLWSVSSRHLETREFYSREIRNAPMPEGQINAGRYLKLMSEIRTRIEKLESCRLLRSADLLVASNREQARLARIRARAFALAKGKEQRDPVFIAASQQEEERWAEALRTVRFLTGWEHPDLPGLERHDSIPVDQPSAVAR